MASAGNIELQKGIPDIKDAFVVLVKTEWNAHIADKLEEGAVRILDEQGIGHDTIVVPGAVEIPFAVKLYAQRKDKQVHAFITLGAVIRGDTPHFDYVCKAVTEGIVWLNMNFDIPTIFSVLTVNTEEQARERVGGIHGHKGEEAAITAIKMIALKQNLAGKK